MQFLGRVFFGLVYLVIWMAFALVVRQTEIRRSNRLSLLQRGVDKMRKRPWGIHGCSLRASQNR